jgi:hypothetical protein
MYPGTGRVSIEADPKRMHVLAQLVKHTERELVWHDTDEQLDVACNSGLKCIWHM